MEESNVKVSVVMATYNGAAFVSEQIDSILNQTYPIYEIIIQDDCSTDNTWSILKSYENRYTYIKCFRNDSNLRAHETFKSAFSKATGDYIAPCDQDDIWVPTKIEILRNLIGDDLMAHSQSDILYMDNVHQNSFRIYNPYVSFEKLIFINYFPGHALLFHRSLIQYLAITSNFEISYDHVIALCSLWKKSFKITNEKLQIWRRHENVCTISVKQSNLISNTKKRKISGFDKFIYTVKKFLKKQTSKAITNAFEARQMLLLYLLAESPNDCELTKLHMLTVLIKNQDVISYVRAGFLCIKLRRSLFSPFGSENPMKKITSLFYAFLYPFIFWYDMHREHCL